MDRILKGYWDCTYCNTRGIDGLVDVCPNCGKAKSANVKYYMNKDIEVTDYELRKAGIKREECDGYHQEWICPKCKTLNKYRYDSCISCGTSKTKAIHEYGGNKIDDNLQDNETTVKKDNEWNTNNPYNTDWLYNVPYYKDEQYKFDWIDWELLRKYIFIGIATILGAFLIVFLFMPITKHVTVDGFSWVRYITIEEERTVDESGWSVPYGGRVYDTSWEISGYEQVFDHYETRYETRSEQVLDHYETHYDYIDNGNGTFTEHSYDVPVYRTEYYDVAYDEPIYRDEPVYDIMYYYEIERWFDVYTYKSEGNDKSPYWNDDYDLNDYERDTKRSEYYYVHFDDGSENSVDYNTWSDMQIDDSYEIVHNRLGIVYSRTQID